MTSDLRASAAASAGGQAAGEPTIDPTVDVAAAVSRLRPYLRRTPTLHAVVDGRPVVFKLEHLQLTGSFKIRGALNALLTAGSPDRVVAASGGNHGLGVATAARLLGVSALIYVPETVPEGKARRIEAAGARLIRQGARYAEADAAARAEAERSASPYVHAYDDRYVVAGQGTIGREIAEDVPGCDAVAAPVGGGGLVSGLAAGFRVDPHDERPVVAVEPEGCACLHHAVEAGRPVPAPVESIASSGLGASVVGDLPFAILSTRPVRLARVTDDELVAARDRLWEELRLAVEPAAAVPFAAWLAGRVPGELPCLVLSGANTDWSPA